MGTSDPKLMKKELRRHCPVCSGDTGEILLTQRFAIPDGQSLPGYYDIVSCERCGFVYADTEAGQKDYDMYYENFSKYEDPGIASGGGATAWDRERSIEIASVIKKFVPSKNSSIVDIGCANGGILAALQAVGYHDLAGIDPSQACVDHIRKRYGIKIAVRSDICSDELKGNALLERGFDCAILSHVIEHICDIKSAFRNISSLVKEGGIIYVETPDARRYADYFVVPYYYFDPEHINHFDRHSIMNLLIANGFEVLDCREKEIRVSNVSGYPAVFAVGKRSADNTASRAISPDRTLKERMLEYAKMSASREGAMKEKLDPLAVSQEPVIVWGAGSFAERLLESSVLGRCNIKAFIDNDRNKWGNSIRGVPIYPPERLNCMHGTVVIASALFSNDIYVQAKAMGITNDLVVLK